MSTCTSRPPAEVRSGSTDDIACWFIDSNCKGESFYLRHAYSTVSRPSPLPDTGKIAIKVTNHYGDEVLQVYDAGSGAAHQM